MPLGKLNLHCVVIDVQERNASFARKADRRAVDMQLAARIPVGPEVVTSSQGTVGIRLYPFVLPGRLERHRTLNVI
jgi:hypothetical protein